MKKDMRAIYIIYNKYKDINNIRTVVTDTHDSCLYASCEILCLYQKLESECFY